MTELPVNSVPNDPVTASSGGYSASCPFRGGVHTNSRVTTSVHWQDIPLVSLDVKEAGQAMRYSPGDVVMIQPQNSDIFVTRFLDLFHLNPRNVAPVKENSKSDFCSPEMLKGPCTIRDLATHYFDLNSIPRIYFFELLARFTINDLEKEKLEEFCTPQVKMNYTVIVIGPDGLC